MGLFNIFKKKDCEICGKEVGMFGYKKLEDGEICKDCVKLLSPWFEERRHSTVAQIKAHTYNNPLKVTDANGTVTEIAINGDVSELYLDIENSADLRYYVFEIYASDKLLAICYFDLYDSTAEFLWNDEISKSSVAAIDFRGADKVRTDYYSLNKGNPTEETIDGKDYVSYTASGGNGTWFAWKPLHSKEYYETEEYKKLNWQAIPRLQGRADHTALDYEKLLEKIFI